MIRLEGVAVYRERMALPADAVLEVTVEDVSRADAPAEALARSSTAAGNAPPIAFVVTYPAAALQAGHRYAVRARILHQDRLLFITDTHHALPPPDSAVPLQLPLVRTGFAQSTP
jgi:putative lipoprotein